MTREAVHQHACSDSGWRWMGVPLRHVGLGVSRPVILKAS